MARQILSPVLLFAGGVGQGECRNPWTGRGAWDRLISPTFKIGYVPPKAPKAGEGTDPLDRMGRKVCNQHVTVVWYLGYIGFTHTLKTYAPFGCLRSFPIGTIIPVR